MGEIAENLTENWNSEHDVKAKFQDQIMLDSVVTNS